MERDIRTPGVPRFTWLILFAASFGGACGGEPATQELSPASALRRRFPDRAAQVLDQDARIRATDASFSLSDTSEASASSRALVTLPREGHETIRFRGFGGVEVRVHEIGTQGKGVLTDHAVAYPRRGGTSFWTRAPEGVEEWLHLEASAVRAGEAVAAWQLDEMTARQRGDRVEIVDPVGVVRLTVTAPAAYAAEGRSVGVWLVAKGTTFELHVDADAEEVLVDPLWVPAAMMNTDRRWHTATRLPDGKVLVAGGESAGAATASAEIYDPATNTWTATGSLSKPRMSHTAVFVNGFVWVTGGEAAGMPLARAEVYDTASGAWYYGSDLKVARTRATATVLPNETVLVLGGTNALMGGAQKSAELFEALTFIIFPAAAPTTGRWNHTATLLPNGKVLVAGGSISGPNSVELYDPATDGWSAVPSMMQDRSEHTATLLPNGKVLVAGGTGSQPLASAELYDPATNTWSAAGSLSEARHGQTATLLDSGEVLVTGGWGGGKILGTAEIYDPATNMWEPAGTMTAAREHHSATLLASGDVLVTGGHGDASFSMTSAERYVLPSPLGSACVDADECASGFCADGVCCDTACSAGACDACTVAGGAASDGVCALLTGTACDDGDLCTSEDTCQAGTCAPGSPVVCPTSDACHEPSVCEAQSGQCMDTAKPDGTPCPGGTCLGGACMAGGSSSSGAGGSGGNGGGGNGGGGGDGGSAGSGTATGAGGGVIMGGGTDGCGCRLASETGAGARWAVLALLPFLRRRRRACAR
ncbi:kelch repeat-containing protein [Polyangium aurulentum]|uniref:kelch repeat-containing protein n=1 Tax=Polyangium aurulentum TaxID=2567896 RepID=UPI0010AED114|nr:kelch repeat-containing protein [Polyangium aurulentum]UQA55776.1 hypothetical protein E8A73_031145 [Polyangium aurulentum]